MFNFKPDTVIVPQKTTALKRFGFAGTLFFTIKGLLWLIVPALIAKGF